MAAKKKSKKKTMPRVKVTEVARLGPKRHKITLEVNGTEPPPIEVGAEITNWEHLVNWIKSWWG
jgi:hypothetical protein